MTILATKNKKIKLILSVIFDLIGYVSYILPGFAEVSDIIWAPVSAWLMTKMYKGVPGKVGAAIAFVEEILPFTDIVPSFTLMWLYTYVIRSEEETNTVKKY
ncbi:hypothetical protein [Kordia zhangzhouensis]|uniref:hypothetical protein n=1 Tax=Kordia zhangzhouensis TaxID=1620405 RepID=UPI0006293116|nr:hypothetical protein [Kordia zhangzhouensis]